MQSVNPKYLIALVLVIGFVVYLKLNNPYREYSTRQFWADATVQTVQTIPDAALKPGNKNGGVLMWAAMGTREPAIIEALVARGAGINEVDGIFGGTPLTGAAGYSNSPEILKALVKLGADIDVRVHNRETAVMVAARYNTNPGIIETLAALGADLQARNAQDKTALDLAREEENSNAEAALAQLLSQ